jgi:MFS family permease
MRGTSDKRRLKASAFCRAWTRPLCLYHEPGKNIRAMTYLRFIIDNRRFLGFGFFLSFFFSFGTTPIIALFGGEIRAEYGLSHGDFGVLYSIANVVAAGGIVWFGRMIDRTDLRMYSALVCGLLIASCLVMSWGPSVPFLFAALVGFRLAGPGLMNHTVGTSMARYFDAGRGRALAITGIGSPVCETVAPIIVVGLIAAIGWRETWMSVGVVLAVVLIPSALWLLKGHGERHLRYLERLAVHQAKATPEGRQWSRGEVLRNPRFYLILPAVLAPPVIIAGLFFHQVHIVESKDWSLAWWAICMGGFAVARVGVTLVSGPIIDRFGATRTLPFYIVPMVLALLVLAVTDHPAGAPIFLVLGGASTGARITAVNAIWAEIYGTTHLGAIRALVQGLIILAIALSPATMGWMFDLGITIEAVALMCIGLLALAALLFFVYLFVSRTPSDRPPSKGSAVSR